MHFVATAVVAVVVVAAVAEGRIVQDLEDSLFEIVVFPDFVWNW